MNNKAWVRQWIAIAMTFYVILMGFGHGVATMFDMTTLDKVTLFELLAPALGFIGWFFRARDVEKKKDETTK